MNTGKTIRDVEIMSKNIITIRIYETYNEYSLIGDQLVAKKKNEKFKRIKCSTLAKLLQECNYDESVYNLANQQ